MVLWVVSNGVITYLCMGFSAPGTLGCSGTIYTPHCSQPGREYNQAEHSAALL
jgi:hypothetical protein